ncbi:MAG: SDR family oxidoreductase [Parabacteroides sp.]|nr:SDR family oxidoreductase [Parabacteroides sp.]MCI7009914.1 SDR family oxidoreductase [Parabacteroides sp.]
MADNYLEKKFDEYQQRKRTSPKGRTSLPSQPMRRVFITGGANGIGQALVRAFRSAGHRVAFCDVDETKGKELSLRTGASFYPVDVREANRLEACMDQLFEDWGDLDVLINNVGVSDFKPLTACSVEEFDRILSVNLRSAFITARRLAQHREQLTAPNPFGRIINLCSTRYLMSEPGTEAYAASKGGIYSLTHALAISLAPYHITVNCISPGWIQNQGYASLRPEDHAQHPSGRVGKPKDVARLALFLTQTENDFINGENLTIDGGMTKKMIYD